MPERENWGAYGVVVGSFDAPSRFSPPSGRAGTGAGSPTCRPHAGVLTAASLVFGLTYHRRLRGRRRLDGRRAAAPDLEVERVPPSRAAPLVPASAAVSIGPCACVRRLQRAHRPLAGRGARAGGIACDTGKRARAGPRGIKKRGSGASPRSRGPSGGHVGCLGHRGVGEGT